MHDHTITPRRRPTAYAAVAAVLLVVLGAVLLAYGSYHRGPASAPLPTQRFAGITPHDLTGHTTAAGPAADTPESALPLMIRPARLYLPSLGIDAAWVGEPMQANGLQIPHDVHLLGLSLTGGQPDSSSGTVLLASHVNYGNQGPGVLSRLYQITPGALVVLTDVRGAGTRWRVTGLDDPLKQDLDPGLFAAAGPRRLVLITCGGSVQHGQYARNVVVTAVPETSWLSS